MVIPVSTLLLLLIVSVISWLIAMLIYKSVSLFMIQRLTLKFQEEKIDSLFNQIRRILVKSFKERNEYTE